MGHIFISYSRNDGNQHADEIERFLQAKGFETWRDVRALKPEEDFTAAIELAIEAASHVLVIVTPDSKRDNSFVRREVQYALAVHENRRQRGESLPVIPVCFESIIPQVSVVNNERIDFSRSRPNAETRLLEILTGSAYTNQPPDSPDPFRPYVQYLYQRVVQYLKSAIITHEIPLTSETAPDAVPPHQPDMLDQFFMAKGIQSGSDDHRTFTNFTEAFAHPDFEHRVLLLGQPGAGKTITLMAYTRDAAAAWLENPAQHPLPLLGTIATWDSYQQPSFADWLGRAYSQLTPTDVQRVLDYGKALLLLDGLDELGGERPVDPAQPDGDKFDPRQRFLSTIDAFVGAHRDAPSHTQILVTCRPKDYDQIGQKIALKGAITLQPLDDDQITAYLSEQPELLNAIKNDNALREVAQTPLLLSIFGFVYKGMTETERAELANLKQAGDIRDKIFNAYVDERYKHEARKLHAELPFSLQEVRAILTRLAWQNLSDRQAAANVITLNNLVQYIDLSKVEQIHIEAFIKLAIRLNLLAIGEENRRGSPTYRFIHLLLRDTVGFSVAANALYDSELSIRSHAADALGNIDDPRALNDLLTALRDTDYCVRFSVTMALGNIGDPRALNDLLTALRDTDYRVRFSVTMALGNIGDPRALGDLLTALYDNDYHVRSGAAQALGSIGDPRVLDDLLTALYDSDYHVRSSAAQALGNIGDPRVLDDLLTALYDSDYLVRSSAADALAKIGVTALDGLLTALRDTKPSVRSSAAQALSNIGVPALDGLLTALCETDADVRRNAADALGSIGDPRALNALLTALRDTDKRVRSNAADALGSIGDPRALNALLTALRDTKPSVRSSAAQALGSIGDPRALNALLTALRETDADVRSSAADALGSISDPRALNALLIALHDTRQSVRSSAAQALAKVGVPALNDLLTALRDTDFRVRSSAAQALGWIGDPRALDVLLTALHDVRQSVRSSAVDALGSIGDPRTLDGLLAALQDTDAYIRGRAASAIEKIGTPEALVAIERWRRDQRKS